MIDTNPDASTDGTKSDLMLALTTKIVAAYLNKHPMPGTELPSLIDRVFQSLAGIATGSAAAPQVAPTPAVPVKKSVFVDYIVCLEDGKKLKMLKRHLMTSYGLTPEAYRERWKLPSNYPMVAPSYADKRSVLAKSLGLGRKLGSKVSVAAEMQPKEQHVTPISKTRGRKLAKAADVHEG